MQNIYSCKATVVPVNISQYSYAPHLLICSHVINAKFKRKMPLAQESGISPSSITTLSQPKQTLVYLTSGTVKLENGWDHLS